MDKPTDAITGNEIDLDEEFFKFKYGLDSDSTDWQEEFPTLKLMDPVAAWITTSPLFDHNSPSFDGARMRTAAYYVASLVLKLLTYRQHERDKPVMDLLKSLEEKGILPSRKPPDQATH